MELLEDFNRSQGAYQRATVVDPYTKLAWKGLMIVASRKVSVKDYLDSAAGLILCCEHNNEMASAVEVLENAKVFARKNTSDANDIAMLKFQLPESPIFRYMEGRLPHPAKTYPKLILYQEKIEKKALLKYQNRNSSRLHAKDVKASMEAMYAIYSKSPVCLTNSLVIHF